MSATRFNDAFRAALALLAERERERPILIRDLRGQLRALWEARPEAALLAALDAALRERLGAYWAGPSLVADDLLAPKALLEGEDMLERDGVRVLERTVTEADWTRGPLHNEPPCPPRATLFGIKGGVGRSTALAFWARHLAKRGRRVLVVDLDLESPGVSTSLLPTGAGPDFGVLDWLVEDAIEQADEALVAGMVAESPLGESGDGEVLVVPCARERDEGYVAKLARAYVELPGKPFATRLARLVDDLERVHHPDVVLLDSRAGLHDVAAVAVTRLDAMTFLFAAESRQTWAGYRLLLEAWQRAPQRARAIRERLAVVAALVPESGGDAYYEKLVSSAHETFQETLYDQSDEPSDELEAFNFDPNDLDAPHYPLRINWDRRFLEWDPLDLPDERQVEAAFGDFLEGATSKLLGELPSQRGLPGEQR